VYGNRAAEELTGFSAADVLGRPMPVSVSVEVLRDPDGTMIGAIVLFRQECEEYQQRRLAMEIQRRVITHGRIEQGTLRVHTLYHPVSEIGDVFESERRDGSAFGVEGVQRFLAGYRGGAPLEQLLGRLQRESPLLQLADDVSAVAVEVLRA
jgi:PAS domain-containing protein